jgi:hypothetical protein
MVTFDFSARVRTALHDYPATIAIEGTADRDGGRWGDERIESAVLVELDGREIYAPLGEPDQLLAVPHIRDQLAHVIANACAADRSCDEDRAYEDWRAGQEDAA